MKSNTKLTKGCDPEYFLVDEFGYGVPLPELVYIHGLGWVDESEPKHPVLFAGETFKVIMDGIAAEFTVPPATTASEMWKYLSEGFTYMRDLAASLGLEFVIKPTVPYDWNKYYSRVDNFYFRWCGVFGCDPDNDILHPEYSCPTLDAKTHPWRYGGGHLHLSDNNTFIHPGNTYPMILAMALLCGNYAIATTNDPAGEALRAKVYGQPGRFRDQLYPYDIRGVEYRSPSSLWTRSEETVAGMFEAAELAYTLAQKPNTLQKARDQYLNETIRVIAEADVAGAQSLYETMRGMA